MKTKTHVSTKAPVAAEDSPRTPHSSHSEARAMLAAPLGLAILFSVVLLAFGLPGVKAEPHDVPIGVAGPAQAVQQVSGALAEREAGAFAVTSYADEAALAAAIRDREVYGGLAVSAKGPKLLTASAGSPVVAQALTAIGTGLASQQGAVLESQDVVPLTADDPRGAGLAVSPLPMLIGALVPVFAVTRVGRRLGSQVVGVLVSALASGFAFAAVLHYGFGSVSGSYLAESAAISAVVGATGLALLGLHTLMGAKGLGLGAAVLVLLGNPLSGATSAPEFLPQAWSAIGQGMPPGAGNQLLRSVAFFEGAGAAQPMLVLGCWALAGMLLVGAGAAARRSGRSRRRVEG